MEADLNSDEGFKSFKSVFYYLENFSKSNGYKLKKDFFQNKNLKNKDLLNEIKWDYNLTKTEYQKEEIVFQCRVDDEKKMNVYRIKSFSYDNQTFGYDTYKSCYELFNNNDYPITVILDKNMEMV